MAVDRETQAIVGRSGVFQQKVGAALQDRMNTAFTSGTTQDKQIAKELVQRFDQFVASLSFVLASAGLDMTSTDAALDTAVDTAWDTYIGISLGIIAP